MLLTNIINMDKNTSCPIKSDIEANELILKKNEEMALKKGEKYIIPAFATSSGAIFNFDCFQ